MQLPPLHHRPAREYPRGRKLTAGERNELRHYLQVLSEQARSVRNAVEPETGVVAIHLGQWQSQWDALKRDLDSVTERLETGK